MVDQKLPTWQVLLHVTIYHCISLPEGWNKKCFEVNMPASKQKKCYKIDPTKHEDIKLVFSYLKRENQKQSKKLSKSDDYLYQKVSDILKVSKGTVINVIKNRRNEAETASHEVRNKLDNFDRAVIRRKINSLYAQRILPTTTVILKEIRPDINICASTLRTALKSMGFCWRKTGDDRRVAIERYDVTAARAKYLRDIKKCRSKGLDIVYLDETWVNQNHHKQYAWLPDLKLLGIDADKRLIRTLPKLPSGKGKRLIVLHAGSAQQGFIPEMKHVFIASKSDGDYHGEMNSKVFLEWFEKLCQKLPRPSAIVLDNASYHNTKSDGCKCPTMSSRKAVLQKFLSDQNVAFEPKMTKPELYVLVKQHKPPVVYKTDVIAQAHDHVVLRTPPRMCELNPIELIWAKLKMLVAERNTTFKLKDVQQHVHDVMSEIDASDWSKTCGHVIKIEREYRQVEGIIDEHPPVIINLESDNSDVSDSDDSDAE